jgi:glycolate oxidase FAD binding subunit
VIVEATFKLAPLPKAREALVAAFATAAEACAFAAELQRRGLSLRAVQLLDDRAATQAAPPDGWALVLELAGTSRAVERTRKEVRELAGDSADLRGGDEAAAAEAAARIASPDGAVLLCKATALPTRLPALIEAVGGIDGAASVLAWPTVGVVYVSWTRLDDVEGAIARLRAAAAAAGGTLVVERCPLDVKRRLDVFGPPPAGFDLMRSVKQQFDPAGVLSPGRYLGRL